MWCFFKIPTNSLYKFYACKNFTVIIDWHHISDLLYFGKLLHYCIFISNIKSCDILAWQLLYPLLQWSWKGVYWFHLVRLSVRLSVCPSVYRIVSALYLQQYLLDPFHICTSYEANSEGVSRVKFVSIALKFPVWGAPSAFCEVGVQEEFGHNLVSCGLMWLTSFMGQPLFALGLTCICFVSRDFLSLKGGPSANSKLIH